MTFNYGAVNPFLLSIFQIPHPKGRHYMGDIRSIIFVEESGSVSNSGYEKYFDFYIMLNQITEVITCILHEAGDKCQIVLDFFKPIVIRK
jgi:hypothetical protein